MTNRLSEDSGNRLLISVSGGETSSYMAIRLLQDLDTTLKYPHIIVAFANTGEENEETLVFLDRCEEDFGRPVTWVEAVTHPVMGVGVAAKVVDFSSASRRGEPFEALIAKHGIVNNKRPFCSKELKAAPLRAYLRAVGWGPGTYDTAIGIRADERDRCAGDAAARRIIYPLVHQWPTTKAQVNAFWSKMPYRLLLKGYQGNCKWCWKKSVRKHLTLLNESPEVFDFPERMEEQYGEVGAEFKKQYIEGYRRTFFRGNRSVKDLKKLLAEKKSDGSFKPAEDDSRVTASGFFDLGFDPDLDTGDGACGSDTCEVPFDSDDEDFSDL